MCEFQCPALNITPVYIFSVSMDNSKCTDRILLLNVCKFCYRTINSPIVVGLYTSVDVLTMLFFPGVNIYARLSLPYVCVFFNRDLRFNKIKELQPGSFRRLKNLNTL